VCHHASLEGHKLLAFANGHGGPCRSGPCALGSIAETSSSSSRRLTPNLRPTGEDLHWVAELLAPSRCQERQIPLTFTRALRTRSTDQRFGRATSPAFLDTIGPSFDVVTYDKMWSYS
jgi:hypothetical protein